MKKNKLVVGIDINEIFRAKWLTFDRFFAQEFGEEGIPENPYTYDLFNNYPWKEVNETINILKDDAPVDINPIDYQPDENGVAKADSVLFKKENIHLTAKEAYNRFMYEDFVFEIFAKTQMYRGLDLHVQQFYKKYCDTVEFILLSKENWFSIPPTLSFLSIMLCRFKNIRFVDEANEMWNGVDILITTDPEILDNEIPDNKKIIKMERPYNINCQNGVLKALQIADLLENEEFQSLIGYVKPIEEKLQETNKI
jgi:hypothetical protein